ncbi:MAG: DUF1700 domain-containing protein [Clostridiaceae bacterium]|nr:DUF1700 domain-containing protein [Clostridiaceae bacterium]
MDDRIKKYLKELEQHLAVLPEHERKEALDYYSEYMNDALEEGKSYEELLSELDTAERTAAAIKAETSIKNVRSDPGLKNYSRLVRYARIGFTKPLTLLMFSLLIFTTYSIAILLFLGTVISAAAACLILPALVYEALKIPSGYIAEIAGTIGIGVFLSGLMMLAAYGFFVLCRPLFRLSANLISKMINKDKGQVGSTEPTVDAPIAESKKRKSGRALKAGLVIIAVSLLITVATGLPLKLFMIFNSMKPSSITVHSQEFTMDEVDRIDITTAHSLIRLKEGSSDKILLEYEKSDWLEFDISCSNGQLSFREGSNGRLPLFSLVSMHENRAELTVALPAGYRPDKISLESKGGFLYIEEAHLPVEAKTYTGSIFIDVPGITAADGIPDTVSTTTARGSIYVGGEIVKAGK